MAVPHVRATDLPRIRDNLLEFSASPEGTAMRAYMAREQGYAGEPFAAAVRSGIPGLDRAELFYIRPEMCELAGAAARTLPEFTLDADDPPSPSGMLWFATPVEDIESPDDRKPFGCVAVVWSVQGRQLWITTLIDRDDFLAGDLRESGLPPICPLGIWPAVLDDSGSTQPIRTTVGQPIMSTVKTVWLLMRQPMAEVEQAPLDRPTRRRYQRRGGEPPAVRVVGMRRPASAGRGGQEVATRQWKHQWIVRGHWRQQPYGPGRERRRPIWISPVMKGPQGAPLIGGEKVYSVPAQPGETPQP